MKDQSSKECSKPFSHCMVDHSPDSYFVWNVDVTSSRQKHSATFFMPSHNSQHEWGFSILTKEMEVRINFPLAWNKKYVEKQDDSNILILISLPMFLE